MPGEAVRNAGMTDEDGSQVDSTSYHKKPQAPPPFSADHLRVAAGPPQVVRLDGFGAVLESYADRLSDAFCSFGATNEVACRCDPLLGSIECDVPASAPSRTMSAEDTLTLRVRVADFQAPPVRLRYAVTSADADEHNVLLHADGDALPNHKAAAVVDATDAHVDGRLQHRLLNVLWRERSRVRGGRYYTLLHQCIAECIGTMFIIVFGVGSVCSAVLAKTDVALWHIATVWGFGVALAILVSVSISGAHLNPAVSLALAIFRPNDFSWDKLLPYWLAQYGGGILGGAFNLMVWGPVFRDFEAKKGIVRGEANSLETAKAFGEYFPAPGGLIAESTISMGFALLVEAWGTGILMFVILALTDPRQKVIRNKEMLPFYIGFTVAVLITLYAPLTQAGWNPARDFGPRVVAALAGWGKIAIPGPRNGFWVYIIGPKIGAPIGALLYDLLLNPGMTD